MMGRMAAYHQDLETRGFTREDMVETVARIVYQTVTGRRRRDLTKPRNADAGFVLIGTVVEKFHVGFLGN